MIFPPNQDPWPGNQKFSVSFRACSQHNFKLECAYRILETFETSSKLLKSLLRLIIIFELNLTNSRREREKKRTTPQG